MLRILLFVLLSAVTSLACRPSSPRAEIICYYHGNLNPTLLDPCKCTILVVSNVKMDLNLRIGSDLDFTEIIGLKEKNPNLKIIVSVGGRFVKPEMFVTVVSSVEALTNFTEGITNFVFENSLDGVEIDWRWPGAPRGVKNKDDLTTLMKVLRLGLDQQVQNMSRRSVEDDSERSVSSVLSDLLSNATNSGNETGVGIDASTIRAILDQVTETPLTEQSVDPVFPDEFYDDEEYNPAEGRGSDYLLLDDYLLTSTPEEGEAEGGEGGGGGGGGGKEEEIALQGRGTTSQGDHRAITSTKWKTKSVTKVDRGKIKFKDHFQTDDLDVLRREAYQQSAMGLQGGGWRVAKKKLIGPAERVIRPLEKRIGNGKILILSVSMRPEYIVKAYDLKALTRVVDMFSIPSDNLTSSVLDSKANETVTYHHSRLMGVSDIHNADSLLDLVVSMGVPLDRLILGVPTMAGVFTLEEAHKNLPRSPAEGPPSWISYKEVCSFLDTGNWTIERDEDLTGSYAYLNETWIAYDDPVSLRIKSKYSMLRGLAGVGIHSIDDDDWMGTCSQGPYPLLTSIYEIFTQLARTPRKAVLRSLVRDLETAESTVRASYVGSSTDLRISPFRIVRVVDRTGAIRAIRSNSDTKYECSRQGYYRDPDDCSQFYRCVKFNQYVDDYTVFAYSCPVGLVFDDRWEICAWPSSAPPCDGSSEIFPVPRNKNICDREGYFTDPENCRWFFACRDYYGNGTFTHYEFRCPFGLAYDEENKICNWPWLVSLCGEYDLVANNRGRGKSITSITPYKHNLGGLSNQKDCINCENAAITIGGEGIYHPEKGIIVAASYFDQASKSNYYGSQFKQPTAINFGFPSSHTSSADGKSVSQSKNNRGSLSYNDDDDSNDPSNLSESLGFNYNTGRGSSRGNKNVNNGEHHTSTFNTGQSQFSSLNKQNKVPERHKSKVQQNGNHGHEYTGTRRTINKNTFGTAEAISTPGSTQNNLDELEKQHSLFISKDRFPQTASNSHSYTEPEHRFEENSRPPSASSKVINTDYELPSRVIGNSKFNINSKRDKTSFKQGTEHDSRGIGSSYDTGDSQGINPHFQTALGSSALKDKTNSGYNYNRPKSPFNPSVSSSKENQPSLSYSSSPVRVSSQKDISHSYQGSKIPKEDSRIKENTKTRYHSSHSPTNGHTQSQLKTFGANKSSLPTGTKSASLLAHQPAGNSQTNEGYIYNEPSVSFSPPKSHSSPSSQYGSKVHKNNKPTIDSIRISNNGHAYKHSFEDIPKISEGKTPSFITNTHSSSLTEMPRTGSSQSNYGYTYNEPSTGFNPLGSKSSIGDKGNKEKSNIDSHSPQKENPSSITNVHSSSLNVKPKTAFSRTRDGYVHNEPSVGLNPISSQSSSEKVNDKGYGYREPSLKFNPLGSANRGDNYENSKYFGFNSKATSVKGTHSNIHRSPITANPSRVSSGSAVYAKTNENRNRYNANDKENTSIENQQHENASSHFKINTNTNSFKSAPAGEQYERSKATARQGSNNFKSSPISHRGENVNNSDKSHSQFSNLPKVNNVRHTQKEKIDIRDSRFGTSKASTNHGLVSKSVEVDASPHKALNSQHGKNGFVESNTQDRDPLNQHDTQSHSRSSSVPRKNYGSSNNEKQVSSHFSSGKIKPVISQEDKAKKGYSYEEPSLPFNPLTSQSKPKQGYNYEEPSIPFNPFTSKIKSQEGSNSDEEPLVPFSHFSPQTKAKKDDNYEEPSLAFSPFSHQIKSKGSNFEEPSVAFNPFSPQTKAEESDHSEEETSVSFNSSNPQIKTKGYNYEEPSIPFNPFSSQTKSKGGDNSEEEPSIPFTHFNHQIEGEKGDNYEEPSVPFNPFTSKTESQEGNDSNEPSVQFNSFSSQNKATESDNAEEEISVSFNSSGSQIKTKGGYNYEEPSVPFNPFSSQTKVKEGGNYEEEPSVSFNPSGSQIKAKEGYNYEKPSKLFNPFSFQSKSKGDNFEESVIPFTKAKGGYNYEEPSVPIDPFSFKAKSNEGYKYEEPSVSFNPFNSQVSTGKSAVSNDGNNDYESNTAKSRASANLGGQSRTTSSYREGKITSSNGKLKTSGISHIGLSAQQTYNLPTDSKRQHAPKDHSKSSTHDHSLNHGSIEHRRLSSHGSSSTTAGSDSSSSLKLKSSNKSTNDKKVTRHFVSAVPQSTHETPTSNVHFRDSSHKHDDSSKVINHFGLSPVSPTTDNLSKGNKRHESPISTSGQNSRVESQNYGSRGHFRSSTVHSSSGSESKKHDGSYKHDPEEDHDHFSVSKSNDQHKPPISTSGQVSGVKSQNYGSRDHFGSSGVHINSGSEDNKHDGSYKHGSEGGRGHFSVSKSNDQHTSPISTLGQVSGVKSQNYDSRGHFGSSRIHSSTGSESNKHDGSYKHNSEEDHGHFSVSKSNDHNKSPISTSGQVSGVKEQNYGSRSHFGSSGVHSSSGSEGNRHDGSYKHDSEEDHGHFTVSKSNKQHKLPISTSGQVSGVKSQNYGAKGHFGSSKVHSSSGSEGNKHDGSYKHDSEEDHGHFSVSKSNDQHNSPISTSGQVSGVKKQNYGPRSNFGSSGVHSSSGTEGSKFDDGSYKHDSGEDHGHFSVSNSNGQHKSPISTSGQVSGVKKQNYGSRGHFGSSVHSSSGSKGNKHDRSYNHDSEEDHGHFTVSKSNNQHKSPIPTSGQVSGVKEQNYGSRGHSGSSRVHSSSGTEGSKYDDGSYKHDSGEDHGHISVSKSNDQHKSRISTSEQVSGVKSQNYGAKGHFGSSRVHSSSGSEGNKHDGSYKHDSEEDHGHFTVSKSNNQHKSPISTSGQVSGVKKQNYGSGGHFGSSVHSSSGSEGNKHDGSYKHDSEEDHGHFSVSKSNIQHKLPISTSGQVSGVKEQNYGSRGHSGSSRVHSSSGTEGSKYDDGSYKHDSGEDHGHISVSKSNDQHKSPISTSEQVSGVKSQNYGAKGHFGSSRVDSSSGSEGNKHDGSYKHDSEEDHGHVTVSKSNNQHKSPISTSGHVSGVKKQNYGSRGHSGSSRVHSSSGTEGSKYDDGSYKHDSGEDHGHFSVSKSNNQYKLPISTSGQVSGVKEQNYGSRGHSGSSRVHSSSGTEGSKYNDGSYKHDSGEDHGHISVSKSNDQHKSPISTSEQVSGVKSQNYGAKGHFGSSRVDSSSGSEGNKHDGSYKHDSEEDHGHVTVSKSNNQHKSPISTSGHVSGVKKQNYGSRGHSGSSRVHSSSGTEGSKYDDGSYKHDSGEDHGHFSVSKSNNQYKSPISTSGQVSGVKKQNYGSRGHSGSSRVHSSSGTEGSKYDDGSYKHDSGEDHGHFSVSKSNDQHKSPISTSGQVSGVKSQNYGAKGHFGSSRVHSSSGSEGNKHDGSYKHDSEEDHGHFSVSKSNNQHKLPISTSEQVSGVKEQNYGSRGHSGSSRVHSRSETEGSKYDDGSYKHDSEEDHGHFTVSKSNDQHKSPISTSGQVSGVKKQNYGSRGHSGSSRVHSSSGTEGSKYDDGSYKHDSVEDHGHFSVSKSNNQHKLPISTSGQVSGVKKQNYGSRGHFGSSVHSSSGSEGNKHDGSYKHDSEEDHGHFSVSKSSNQHKLPISTSEQVSGVKEQNYGSRGHSGSSRVHSRSETEGSKYDDGSYKHDSEEDHGHFTVSKSNDQHKSPISTSGQVSGVKKQNYGSRGHSGSSRVHSSSGSEGTKHDGSYKPDSEEDHGHFSVSKSNNQHKSPISTSGQVSGVKKQNYGSRGHSGSSRVHSSSGTEGSKYDDGSHKHDSGEDHGHFSVSKSNDQHKLPISTSGQVSGVKSQNYGAKGHFGSSRVDSSSGSEGNKHDGSYKHDSEEDHGHFSVSKSSNQHKLPISTSGQVSGVKEQNYGSRDHSGSSRVHSSSGSEGNKHDGSYKPDSEEDHGHFSVSKSNNQHKSPISTSGQVSGVKEKNYGSRGHFGSSRVHSSSGSEGTKHDESYKHDSREDHGHFSVSKSKDQHELPISTSRQGSRVKSQNDGSRGHFGSSGVHRSGGSEGNKDDGSYKHDSEGGRGHFSVSKSNTQHKSVISTSGQLSGVKKQNYGSRGNFGSSGVQSSSGTEGSKYDDGSYKHDSEVYSSQVSSDEPDLSNNHRKSSSQTSSRGRDNSHDHRDPSINVISSGTTRTQSNPSKSYHGLGNDNIQLATSIHFGTTGSLQINHNEAIHSRSQTDSSLRGIYPNLAIETQAKSKSHGKSINSGSGLGHSFSNKNTKNGFSVRKPLFDEPSLLTKLGNKPKFQRFGPGGVRNIYDDLGPGVCERAGLFRHPHSCDKFYECYWDRWLEKFTLHIFDCPVTIVYDSRITACNWPFNGPPCTDDNYS